MFDEATSSLDTSTEQAVMESIEQLSKDLTIVIIAHRLLRYVVGSDHPIDQGVVLWEGCPTEIPDLLYDGNIDERSLRKIFIACATLCK